jgi:hypothetical protein
MPTTSASRDRLVFRLFFIPALAVISAFLFSLTWGDRIVGYLSDDAIYLLMAEMFSPWRHVDSLVLESLKMDNHFPPLYPVILGLFGASPSSPALASLVTVACLIIAIATYGIWIRRETGGRLAAVSLPLAFALLPGTILFSQGLWSEFLFMVFFYGALALLAEKTPDGRRWLAASLLIALSSLTRAVGVSFIAALWLYLILRRPRRYALYMLVSALPFAYWALFINVHSDGHGYFGILLNSFTAGHGHLPQLLHQMLIKLATLFDAWRWQFHPVDWTGYRVPAEFFSAVLLFAALIGFGHRLYHRKPDALFLTFYTVTVLLWPFSDLNFVSRFLFPVVPLLLFYIFHAAGLADGRPRYRHAAALILAFSLAAAMLPVTSSLLHRAYAGTPPDLAAYKHDRAWFYSTDLPSARASAKGSRQLFRALRKVSTIVPVTDCIFSFHTALVMLYANRVSGVLPPPSASGAQFTYGTRGCRYMVAMPLTSINNDYPKFYPLARVVGDSRYAIIPIMPRNARPGDKPVLYLIRRKDSAG